MAKLILFFISLFVLSISSFSCRYKTKETDNNQDINKTITKQVTIGNNNYTFAFPDSREIFRIDTVRFFENENLKIVSLSRFRDSITSATEINHGFDFIDVFMIDTLKSELQRIFTDTVYNSVECSYLEFEKGFPKKILIYTDAEGIDTVASKGMLIYNSSFQNNINLVKYFDSGKPVVSKLNGNEQYVIMTYDNYWGIFTFPDQITYLKDIYTFEKDSLVIVNDQYKYIFENQSADLRKKFDKYKYEINSGRKLQEKQYPLYKEMVGIFLNMLSINEIDNINDFWNSEKEYLVKHLREDQFLDLNNFVKRIEIIGK